MKARGGDGSPAARVATGGLAHPRTHKAARPYQQSDGRNRPPMIIGSSSRRSAFGLTQVTRGRQQEFRDGRNRRRLPFERNDDQIRRSRGQGHAMAEKGETLLGQKIASVVTVNGVRVTLADGTWGLVRASSNKPSLVVVVESPVS